MVQLPTLDVTQAQAARIQNSFPGATQAERVEAFRAWLREALRNHVKVVEQEALRSKFEADLMASAGAVESDLSSI